MHRKLIALLLTACLMAGSTVPVFASTEAVVATDEDKVLDDDVDTEGKEGVTAEADTQDASVDGGDHDITVTHEYDEHDTDDEPYSVGAVSEANGEGLTAKVEVHDVCVSSVDDIQVFGIQAVAEAPEAMAIGGANDVEVFSDPQLTSDDAEYPTVAIGAFSSAGDISETGDVIDGTNGGTAIVSVQNVDVYATRGGAIGGQSEAIGESSVAVTYVGGNLNVESADTAYGIGVIADEGGRAGTILNIEERDGVAANVRGGGEAAGVMSQASGGGTAYAQANGPVNVSASNIDGTAFGVESFISGDESIAMAYAGDLSVTGHDAVGLAAGAQDVSHGLVETMVSGDIDVSGKNALAMDLWSEDTEDVSMFAGVNGDVHSTGNGVFINTAEGTEVEVLVTGTLKVDNGPAIVIGQNTAPEDVHIIAWKIESNADSLVQDGVRGTSPAAIDITPHSDKARAVENDIYYILKVDSTQADNINIVSGAEDYRYLDMDNEGLVDTNIAHAGDKVGIKLDIPEGYELKAAYGDAEHTIVLTRGDDGNYYLIVPKGGGVTINMVLSPIESKPAEPDEKDNKNDSSDGNKNEDKTVYTSTFTIANSMAVASIGGTGQVSMAMADLISYISQGATSIVINTPAGSFIIPLDMELLALLAGGNVIRFVLNGSVLEIYVDGGTVPVKTVSIAG
ncbi:MAG: hypothetical protein K5770_19980 [Lachnospiraceae bacterium]|nr:hypothetical protein [Lachnospiraceae bacterium]